MMQSEEGKREIEASDKRVQQGASTRDHTGEDDADNGGDQMTDTPMPQEGKRDVKDMTEEEMYEEIIDFLDRRENDQPHEFDDFSPIRLA